VGVICPFPTKRVGPVDKKRLTHPVARTLNPDGEPTRAASGSVGRLDGSGGSLVGCSRPRSLLCPSVSSRPGAVDAERYCWGGRTTRVVGPPTSRPGVTSTLHAHVGHCRTRPSRSPRVLTRSNSAGSCPRSQVVGGDVSVSVDRSTINSRCPVGGVALLVSILDRYAPTHQAVPFTPRYTSAFLSYSQLWGRRLPAHRRTWSLVVRRVTHLETVRRVPAPSE
jgi:hypothetical protein